MKRITIAILFGLVAGLICASGAFYGHILKFSVVALLWILLNRAVMGFVIGISGLKVHWAWNGAISGLLVGSIFSYSLFMNAGLIKIAAANFFVNALFGLMMSFSRRRYASRERSRRRRPMQTLPFTPDADDFRWC